MRAAYIEGVGPPESIRYGDLPTPTVGFADLLVKVGAVCVDPVDTYIRSDRYPVALRFPFVIGRDLAGTVAAVGAAVTHFRPAIVSGAITRATAAARVRSPNTPPWTRPSSIPCPTGWTRRKP